MTLVPCSLRSLDRKTRATLLIAAILGGLLALCCDSIVIYKTGVDTPLVGDADFFAILAKSVATNHGYRLAKSSWPNELNTSRAPLWPAILSITYRLRPDAPLASASRFTNAVLHGISAGLMVLLAYQLAGALMTAALCGGLLAIYPPETVLAVGGFSEVAFLAVFMLGVILLLESGKVAFIGALLCGLGVLARSNYLLLPVFLILVLLAFRREAFGKKEVLRKLVLLTAVFYFFPMLWMLRNYSVTGAFPLLSTMEGETLYGANNVLVANDLNQWGYWTMPNEIPGEQKKQILAQTRNELELNRYYHDKAMAFIKSDWRRMPRLIVGKLVRGFVPAPWVPLTPSYIAFGFRFLLYCSFAFALYRWRQKQQFYAVMLAGMFLVILTTTVVYYGVFRFTFCLEPFLFPVIAAAYSEHKRGAVGPDDIALAAAA